MSSEGITVQCLLCQTVLKPFHVLKKKALVNKPVREELPDAVLDMALAYCCHCHHISSRLIGVCNRAEIDKRIYAEAYEGYPPSGLSTLQRRYIEFIAEWIASFLSPSSRILEIGCHDGCLLELLAKQGHSCEGVEPSPFAEVARSRGLLVHREFYNEQRFEKGKYDLVITRHVVEHLPEPVAFVESIARLLKVDGLLYVEVPNSLGSLEQSFYPEFHVDHISYFTAASLEWLLRRCGLHEILHLESYHAYMKFPFLAAIARCSHAGRSYPGKWLIDFRMEDLLQSFPIRHARYLQRLRSLRTEGRLAVWGTGSIGTQFAIDAGWKLDEVVYVDPNPANQGKLLSVTGHPVFPPQVIEQRQCEAVLIASGWEEDVRMQISKVLGKNIKLYTFTELVA